MKALKLILIAVVMAGALAGLMMLSLGGDSQEKATPEQEALYSKLQSKIEKHWQSNTWQLTQFNDDHIMLNKQKNDLGSSYYTSLTDQLNDAANRALCQAVLDAWSRPTCRLADIEPYMADMERFLQKARGYDKDRRIKDIQATYALYKEALSLAQTNFRLTPRFDMENNKYGPSFRNFKKKQLQLVSDIKQSAFFGNISKVNEVREALQGVGPKLEEAETVFANALARLIVNAYQRERDQLGEDNLGDHRARFRTIRQEYNAEFQTNDNIEAYILSLPTTIFNN